jgi:hypothetical protein
MHVIGADSSVKSGREALMDASSERAAEAIAKPVALER